MIILLGFSGAGKTTIGKLLGERMGLPVLDTDEMIEEREGRKIRDIFSEEGEACFRDLETGLLEELVRGTMSGQGSYPADRTEQTYPADRAEQTGPTDQTNPTQRSERKERSERTDQTERPEQTDGTQTPERAVLSLGGGMPVREINRPLLRRLGRIFYLQASVDTLERRLRGTTDRPLLQAEDLRKRIEELFRAREAIYLETADEIIRTDEQTPEETAAFIARLAVT